MKKFRSIVLLLSLCGLFSFQNEAKGQLTIHTINVKTPEELIDFFIFTPLRSPLISAHRGGARIGYPENCIATFENTLIYTPSIFEVDPRLTKDSVVVLLHDETLDRTTTGKGKLSDYTWEELKDIKLKDVNGHVTPYGLPLLDEALEWCKGKTILVLDDKGVPYPMVCNLVRKHNAFSNILMTVRNAKIARQFYDLDKRFAFEAYVFDLEDVAEYEAEGIPWPHVMAYIGSEDVPGNKTLINALNKRGVKAMISGAPSLDKAFLNGNRNVFPDIFNHGSDIIETNLPVQAAEQISGLINPKGNVCKYFGKAEIPLSQIKYIP